VDVRREGLRVGGLALLGVAAGAAAKWADESPVGWLGELGTYAGVWILALALVARLAPAPRAAAWRAAAFFAALAVAYYAWAEHVLGFAPGGRALALWLVVALTAAPGGAAALAWAFPRRGPVPAALVALAAGAVLADRGVVWQVWWASVLDAAPDGFRLRPVRPSPRSCSRS